MTNHCGHCDVTHEGYRKCPDADDWCTGCYPLPGYLSDNAPE